MRVLFVAMLLTATAISYLKPDVGGWDTLGFLGVVRNYETGPCAAQAAAYRDIEILPLEVQTDLLTGLPQRIFKANDCASFTQYLSLYAIRPGYTFLAYGLTRLGLPPVLAFQFISLASFVGMGWLLFSWASLYTSSRVAVVLITPTILAFSAAARIITPDAFSTFVCLLGLYLILQTKQAHAGLMVLLLSMFIRTDNVFLLGAACLYLLLEDRLTFRMATGFLVCGMAILALVSWKAAAHPLATLWWVSFIEQVTYPADFQTNIGPLLYAKIEIKNAFLLLMKPTLYVVLPVAAFLLISPSKFRGMLLLLLGITVIKFALYPSGEQRHLLVLVGFSVICIARELAAKREYASSAGELVG